jgi:hypothetical protein
MATIVLATFNDGDVRFEFDYHDQNRRVQRGRCINNTALAAVFRVVDGAEILFEQELPPGTTERSVAQGKALVDEGGELVFPYGVFCGWPSWL